MFAFIILFGFFSTILAAPADGHANANVNVDTNVDANTVSAEGRYSESSIEALYQEIGLDGMVSYGVFEQAIQGYEKVGAKDDGKNGEKDGRKDVDKDGSNGDELNREILTLIDFSKPSDQERLFVLDLRERKILCKSVVAHGRGSGDKYATSFSNTNGSHKSSLGFYRTGVTYTGNNGYSLRLDGLEKGINDMAYQRAIVIHGADYCSPEMIRSTGRLGRSFGCPALPRSVNDEIIDIIKGGTLLFIYAADPDYALKSQII